MSNTSVDAQNAREVELIKKRLWGGVRLVTEKAAANVLRSLVLGTWQDSSNAAFNWQFDLSTQPASGYIFYKGQAPVGNEGDNRSLNESPVLQLVANYRKNTSEKALYAHLFSVGYSSSMPKFSDFSVVNPVEDFSQSYAYSADISDAARNGGAARIFDLTISSYGHIYL